MKIALYVPSWPPGVAANGIVTYASQLVPALRGLGHEVFVLTLHKEQIDNDPYTIDLRQYSTAASTLWNRLAFRVAFKLAPGTADIKAASFIIASAISDLVDKHKLDVFEIEESFGWSFAVSRLRLLPVVLRLHGPWFLNGRFGDPDTKKAVNRRRIKWEGRAIEHAQFVTAPSAEVLQAVQNHYSLSLTASLVIPNPLKAAAEAEIWDIKTCDINRLLFVGRFDAHKGGDLVLRAFAELATLYPILRLTFVGPNNGIMRTDGNTHSLEFFRTILPTSSWSRIEFCGPMSHFDVMSLRRKHFVTIIASRYEIMPYSVLEPMSLGCPLVATAVGGIPEVITDQRNGILVPSQDVKALTSACEMLLNDPAMAARLGRQAWRDCCDLYSPKNVAKQTIAAYEQAINNFRLRNTY